MVGGRSGHVQSDGVRYKNKWLILNAIISVKWVFIKGVSGIAIG
jgi:hypothetical protein